MQNPNSAISRIAACKYNDNDTVDGSVTDFTNGSRMIINFDQPKAITPGQTDTLELVVDISDSPGTKNFMIAFVPDTSVFILDSQTLNTPNIETEPGKSIFESDFVVILANNLKESFLNYPNPFGSGDKPTGMGVQFLQLLSTSRPKRAESS